MNLRIPWWAKVGSKVVLSRLPVNYATWQRLNLFRHGQMDASDYAIQVCAGHIARFTHHGGALGFVGLELGPGDSIAAAAVANTLGASRMVLVDTGPFATRDMAAYARLLDSMRGHGMPVNSSVSLGSLEEFAASCHAEYLSEGLRSLESLPSGSVDFVWSQAVLEHIRARDFEALTRQIYRILRPGGLASHRVDLQDHLGGALNNLRFSRKLWESEWLARSGFYTNRIRYSAMLECFRSVGFSVEEVAVERWSELPTPLHSLDHEFRQLGEAELAVSGFDVVLRRRT